MGADFHVEEFDLLGVMGNEDWDFTVALVEQFDDFGFVFGGEVGAEAEVGEAVVVEECDRFLVRDA